jgi:hypothetical protein
MNSQRKERAAALLERLDRLRKSFAKEGLKMPVWMRPGRREDTEPLQPDPRNPGTQGDGDRPRS